MGPDLKDSGTDTRVPGAEYRQNPVVNGETAAQGIPPQPAAPPRSASETRRNERLGRLLLQKKGPDAVMLVVLAAALLFGLIGLAVHFLWIVAIIVMALGLGFAVADSRRNRIDIANERTDQARTDRP